MTENDRLIKARLGILALAAELHNVARACKLAGVSRSQFYSLKKAYETYGKEALVPRVRRKPDMPNRTPVLLEEQILLNTGANPTFSYVRLAREMKSKGIGVSPTMVRYVWQRHNLSTRLDRLEWVAKSNGHTGAVKTSGERRGLHKIRPSSFLAVTPHPEFDASRKSAPGKDSKVDWNYWSQRVLESLTR